MTIRVLIVDDNAFLRQRLQEAIESDPELQVVGSAEDPYQARELLQNQDADLMTLDLTMPKLDGLAFLERLMVHRPMPVIVLSGLVEEQRNLSEKALQVGAAAVLAKPHAHQVQRFNAQLRRTIRHCVRERPPSAPPIKRISTAIARTPLRTDIQLIAIGASTGGTEAIRQVICTLPPWSPPVVMVQHMPAHFTTSFAQRLDEQALIQVREAEDGMELLPGQGLLCPGDYHLTLERGSRSLRARLNQEPREHFQRPAVDVSFRSVASCVGNKAIGVLLTGMGKDGATGLLAMHRAGAHTIGQNADSCVVYGMPRAAWECGAVTEQLALEAIAPRLIELLLRSQREQTHG